MKSLLVLISAILLSVSAFAGFSENGLGFDVEIIEGQYESKDRDLVTVNVEQVGQGNGERKYKIEIDVLDKELEQSFYLDETAFSEIKDDGSVDFFYDWDCEDPGCDWGSVNVNFSGDASGYPVATVTINYNRDVSEDLYDDEAEWLTVKEVTKYCQGSFGKNAEGNNENGKYTCSVYREFTAEVK